MRKAESVKRRGFIFKNNAADKNIYKSGKGWVYENSVW